jgi:putative ABC transport system permease protein
MKTLLQDALYGLRMLVRKPGFTAIAVISLALGIGANTVIFSLINTTLLRPLPFPEADRVMVLWSRPVDRPEQRNALNYSAYSAFKKDMSKTMSAVGAFYTTPRNISAEEGTPAERTNSQNFTVAMFDVIGVKPAMGRIFTEDEDQVDNPAPVAIISHRFWQRRFHGDPKVLNQTFRCDGRLTTVIGVMPEGFDFFDDQADLWLPAGFSRAQVTSTASFVLGVGRLRPGANVKQAQSELEVIASNLRTADPERNKNTGAFVQPLQEAAFGGFSNPLLILQGAVAFVLLIGCANVAGLLLARASSRQTEVAVRSALGAGRRRIVRQLLTESVLLSLMGGALGIGFAWAGLRAFVAAAPPGFPRLNEISIDPAVLAFTAALALVTGIVFGLAPALQASKADLVNSLKESGRSGTDSVVKQRIRSALVTAQVGLALVLLVGAGLMINSFVRISNNKLGGDPTSLLTFELRFPQNELMHQTGRYRGVGLWDIHAQTAQTFDRVYQRVKDLPNVASAAAASAPPFSGRMGMQFLIPGRPVPQQTKQGGSEWNAGYLAVTPNYFATMKIPIRQGRDFTDRDNETAPKVIIINEAMVKRFWPNENPLGKSITLDFVPNEQPREIIAIVGDTLTSRQQKEPTPAMYVPHTQQATQWQGPAWNVRAGMYYILRTTGDPMKLVPAARAAVAEIDPNKPLANIRTVEEYLAQQVQYQRLYIVLLGIFGAIAAVLAAVGIYGVMSYSVAQRSHEIGIRMALGASGGQVLKLVVRQALIMVGIGLVIGLAGSFALTRLLSTALWGVTATDPATYIGVSLLLIAVALAACIVPTRRAVTVDPTVTLRFQ